MIRIVQRIPGEDTRARSAESDGAADHRHLDEQRHDRGKGHETAIPIARLLYRFNAGSSHVVSIRTLEL